MKRSFSVLRLLSFLVAAFGMTAGIQAQQTAVTSIVGYAIHDIPGNSERMIPLQFSSYIRISATVTEVNSNGIPLNNAVPANLFEPVGAGFCQVSIGAMAGLAITVTAINGNFVTLERSPVGLISVSDTIEIFADHKLGATIGPWVQHSGFQTGANAQEAENVSVWNARTQSSKVYYYKTDEG